MLKVRLARCMLSAAAATVGASIAFGQSFPYKPIRIVASAPGGGGDFMARLIAQENCSGVWPTGDRGKPDCAARQ